MISVLLVEDKADYRNALKLILDNTPGFCCVADYCDAESCMNDNTYNNADVALIDIQLPGISGIQLVSFFKEKNPALLCLMCTAYEDGDNVFSALQAGAHGYILKSDAPSKILEAIVEVVNGGSPMSSQVARKVIEAFHRPAQVEYSLTNREEEILQHLSKGLLYKEIAFRLSISTETVRRHCFNIYDKLHVNNRTEALNKFFGKKPHR
ncbi:MAG: response regulator transcription factor [Bacteroidetes bacterium]|nr:response regulator transcription factor [Bacteroidota bacterium]